MKLNKNVPSNEYGLDSYVKQISNFTIKYILLFFMNSVVCLVIKSR